MKVFLLISLLAMTACPKADLNGDCRVDLRDFAIFADSWLAIGEPENKMKQQQRKLQEAKKLISRLKTKGEFLIVVVKEK